MLIFNSRKFWSKAEQGESIQNGGVSVCKCNLQEIGELDNKFRKK